MKRPSHATVVAYIALFVALGGTTFAATHLGKNSVGSKQLKKNAVTGVKVKDNTLTGRDINESTLGTVPSASRAAPTGPAGGALAGAFPDPAIANSTIGSAQVIDSSLSPTDLSFAPATQSELRASAPIPVEGGSLATTLIGATCTSYAESALTVDAPSAGTVVLSANAWLQTFHTNGQKDEINVSIGTTPTDCGAALGFATKHSIPAAFPTFTSQDITIPVSRIVPVSAGPHTFYMSGYQDSGTDEENFFAEGMAAVFYPK
jgi:hypothetical protein